jgi:hypothetical protein
VDPDSDAARQEDSVRTFTQQMPALQIRGLALRIEIVGACSLHCALQLPSAKWRRRRKRSSRRTR